MTRRKHDYGRYKDDFESAEAALQDILEREDVRRDELEPCHNVSRYRWNRKRPR